MTAQNPADPDALHLQGVIALHRGQFDQAADLINRAILVNGKNAEYFCNLGVVLQNQGRTNVAEEAFAKALSLKPSHIQANLNLANVCFSKNDYSNADKYLKKVLRKLPNHAEALNALGIVHIQNGDLKKATFNFRKAFKAAPGHLDAGINLGNALTEDGQSQEAIECLQSIIRQNHQLPKAHFILGTALKRTRRVHEAGQAYQAAIDLKPDYAEAYNNLANLNRASGKFQEALNNIDMALKISPNDEMLFFTKGVIFRGMGNAAGALEQFSNCLEINPEEESAWEEMVGTCQDCGLFEKAKTTIDRWLAINPQSYRAHRLLSLSGKGNGGQESREILEKAAADQALDGQERAKIHLALGKGLAESGDFESAFEHFRQGNAIIDEQSDCAPDTFDDYVKSCVSLFQPETIEQRRKDGSSSTRPVFIVGMPRSGTSLIEQILASHPEATGGGELMDIEAFTQEIPYLTAPPKPYPGCLEEMDENLTAWLSGEYLGRLDEIDPDAKRVTDKMPTNFMHLGLIAMLFPESRIIHCRRQPEATCLSMYTNFFSGFHPYACDFYNLGRRYRGYERLMEHWRRVLPLKIYDVNYEELIADQQGQSRRLLDFCGLDWSDDVLAFYKTERSVNTVSNWQVRQPIYKSAIDNWKNYEQYLEPLRRGLAGEPQDS